MTVVKRDARKVVSCSFSQSMADSVDLVSSAEYRNFLRNFRKANMVPKVTEIHIRETLYLIQSLLFFNKEYDRGIYLCIHETSYCYTLSNL